MENIIILKKEIFSKVNKPPMKISHFFDVNERIKLDKNLFENLVKIKYIFSLIQKFSKFNDVKISTDEKNEKEKNNNQGKYKKVKYFQKIY